MKTLKFLIILVFAITCLSQEVKNNQLTVYGKVKVFTQADRAAVSFHIKGTGSSLKNAFNDAQTQMSRISTQLIDIGLNDKDISTSFSKAVRISEIKPFYHPRKIFEQL